MPSTAPPHTLSHRHGALAAWRATNSFPRRSTTRARPLKTNSRAYDDANALAHAAPVAARHRRTTSSTSITSPPLRRVPAPTSPALAATSPPDHVDRGAPAPSCPRAGLRQRLNPRRLPRRAPALASPARGGTRAHRPKAEHAGRTRPHLAGAASPFPTRWATSRCGSVAPHTDVSSSRRSSISVTGLPSPSSGTRRRWRKPAFS